MTPGIRYASAVNRIGLLHIHMYVVHVGHIHSRTTKVTQSPHAVSMPTPFEVYVHMYMWTCVFS